MRKLIIGKIIFLPDLYSKDRTFCVFCLNWIALLKMSFCSVPSAIELYNNF